MDGVVVKSELSPQHSEPDPLETPCETRMCEEIEVKVEFDVEDCPDSSNEHGRSTSRRGSPARADTYSWAPPPAKRKRESMQEEFILPHESDSAHSQSMKSDNKQSARSLRSAQTAEDADDMGQPRMGGAATEAFIAALRCRPALWMSSRPHSKYRLAARRLWDEVRLLFPDCPDVKKRWKGLKDTYRKELKKLPAAQLGQHVPDSDIRWKHFRSMSFVREEILHSEGEPRAGEDPGGDGPCADATECPKEPAQMNTEHEQTEQSDASGRWSSKMSHAATEAFIEAMRARPPLWRLSEYPHHKHKRTVRALWAELRQMFPECPDVKKKWKGLKDTYRKELKRVPLGRTSSGALTDVGVRWRYFHLLAFVRDELVSANYDRLVVRCDASAPDARVVLTSGPDFRLEQGSNTSASNGSASPTANTKTPVPSDRDIENRRLRMMELESLMHRNRQEVEKSEDYHFLMSILPRIEQLPAPQRVRVRKRINQVVLEEMEMLADD